MLYTSIVLPIPATWGYPRFTRNPSPQILESVKRYLADRVIESILGRDAEVSNQVHDAITDLAEVVPHHSIDGTYQLLLEPPFPPDSDPRKDQVVGFRLPEREWVYLG